MRLNGSSCSVQIRKIATKRPLRPPFPGVNLRQRVKRRSKPQSEHVHKSGQWPRVIVQTHKLFPQRNYIVHSFLVCCGYLNLSHTFGCHHSVPLAKCKSWKIRCHFIGLTMSHCVIAVRFQMFTCAVRGVFPHFNSSQKAAACFIVVHHRIIKSRSFTLYYQKSVVVSMTLFITVWLFPLKIYEFLELKPGNCMWGFYRSTNAQHFTVKKTGKI